MSIAHNSNPPLPLASKHSACYETNSHRKLSDKDRAEPEVLDWIPYLGPRVFHVCLALPSEAQATCLPAYYFFSCKVGYKSRECHKAIWGFSWLNGDLNLDILVQESLTLIRYLAIEQNHLLCTWKWGKELQLICTKCKYKQELAIL